MSAVVRGLPVPTGSRVVVVCSDPGIPVFGTKGASVHLQAVLTELVRRGHDVHLLTPRPGGPAPDALAAVTVHDLPAVSGTRGREREIAARRSDAAAGVLLDRIHSGRSVDLVLERYSLWGRTATAWAARHGVPSVLEVNAPLVREQAAHRVLVDRAGAEQVAREALGAAGAVVCVSEGVAAWARDVVADPARVHVVPNGVDTDRVTPAARPGGVRPLTVGFVGTLKPWHGTEHLVDAVALLLGREPGWRLLVVGDGPQRDALQERCSRWGIEDAVELVGAVRPDDVVAHLHRMDVGCAPYEDLDDFYFSPLKVYEYLAAGLPVVASRVPGMSGLLHGGALGRLVRPGDAEDLAAALAGLAADPASRALAGERARRTAEREHTWTAVVDRVLALARTGEATAPVQSSGPARTEVA
jgi:glycosyltransferase involved in cell wall biosynthesis